MNRSETPVSSIARRIGPSGQIGANARSARPSRARARSSSRIPLESRNSSAIARRQRGDDRLLLTLWHLAERWGRVHNDGVVVRLPLSRQRLADRVGAHRPSVTSRCAGALARAGAISRREAGEWVLHGTPPEELRHHKRVAALS